jgi:TolB-like protein/DNA-binding response OmpR family regulator
MIQTLGSIGRRLPIREAFLGLQPIQTGLEVMANSDVRLALSVQTIVLAARPRLRRSRHAPRQMRATRRKASEKRCCLPINFPCYPAFGITSDVGMQAVSGGRKIRFGHCTLDDGRGVLLAPNGTETLLRPKTLELLRLFLRNPGRVVGRSEILDAVWPGLFVSDDSITQCVVELRRAMGEVGTALLRTVPRRGYLLQATVMVEEAKPETVLGFSTDSRPSIAVLPFNLNRIEPEEAYFESGIIEGIIHVLSGIDGISVIARGSTVSPAGSEKGGILLWQKFGVRYVLYGGVRRVGTRLRITTELVDTATGAIIRSDRFDGEVESLFELQDRIADQVVASIAPELRERAMNAALRKPPNMLTSYDLVLRALDRMKRDDHEAMMQAKQYLERAMALDSTNTAAYAYAALWNLLGIGEGWIEDATVAIEDASRLSMLALEYNPADALALSVRGHAIAYLERDYLSAMLLLERAMRLGPSCPWAFAWGSLLTSYLGDHAEAVRLGERALRLSPLDPFSYLFEHVLSQALHLSGDHAKAIKWARRSYSANHRHMPNLRVLICALVQIGDIPTAEQMASLLLKRDPHFQVSVYGMRTPLPEPYRTAFVTSLRQAGLPE